MATSLFLSLFIFVSKPRVGAGEARACLGAPQVGCFLQRVPQGGDLPLRTALCPLLSPFIPTNFMSTWNLSYNLWI